MSPRTIDFVRYPTLQENSTGYGYEVRIGGTGIVRILPKARSRHVPYYSVPFYAMRCFINLNVNTQRPTLKITEREHLNASSGTLPDNYSERSRLLILTMISRGLNIYFMWIINQRSRFQARGKVFICLNIFNIWRTIPSLRNKIWFEFKIRHYFSDDLLPPFTYFISSKISSFAVGISRCGWDRYWSQGLKLHTG